MPIPGGVSQGHARLGRYELLARLATGGMGEIFLARLSGAEGFEKLYVVKRILAHLADDARFRQMLIAEASIASKMSHPHICQVFELGETEGQLYIVMEYLEGVSLLPLLRRFSRENTALDLGFVAGVIQQVTDAMNYAHELKDREGENLGIIHRDVTPSNIFLTEAGVAKVLDFGIAKARGASTQTQEGTVKGKYAYMAPEQLKGSNIDRRVDIFALGVVLYEMLALRRLFQRKTDYLTFRAVMEQPIPDIRRYRPDLPEGVADALTRALDRDPMARFETARQFGTAILDGSHSRPWTQGEISDFVHANFAEEIGKRSQQVASVVARTQSGVSARATMPLLIHPDEGTHEGDDDESFPSVETEVDGPPLWMPRPSTPPRPLNPGNSADFAAHSTGGTPQPFGLESTGSAPMLQPLRGQPVMPPTNPNAQPIVVMPRRSVFWPIFGVLMVAIAGGALFLVWQQMQNQQPSKIEITQAPVTKPLDPPPDKVETHKMADMPTNPDQGSAGSAETPGPGPGPNVRKPPKRSFNDQLNSAMSAKLGDLRGCLNEHADGLPAKGKQIMASIAITTTGKTKSVSLQPDNIDTSPLGGCLKNVIKRIEFPEGRDTSFTVPLTPKNG
ncbi:MAG TPA: protein kinase [Kofleriaceae bacterium]